MSDTAARLLKLLSLLQTPRDWPGSELAARLEVSGRTIRRDIDRLRDLGYPVEAAMGAVGGYRLVGGTAMPPLLLDDDEAVAIAIGLRTVVGPCGRRGRGSVRPGPREAPAGAAAATPDPHRVPQRCDRLDGLGQRHRRSRQIDPHGEGDRQPPAAALRLPGSR